MELFRRTSSQPHPADWSQAPKATKLLALAVIVLVATGIGFMQLSSRAYETQGPSRIARNANGITLVNAYEMLFLVDGQQVTKLTATDLGLGGPINSITADGNDWLLGDDDSGLLYRCNALLSRCQPLFAGRTERLFSRAHGVAFLDNRLVISDSERHRLRVYDSSGKEIATTRTEPIALCYPNDVIVVDGMLYVTDTNNLRIARIDPATFKSETFIQTAAGAPLTRANCADISSHVAERGDAYGNLMLDTVNSVGRPTLPIARSWRVLPASVLHTQDDRWWVVQMKNLMTLGDVIVYSSDGQPQLRVKLPEDSEPTNMLETSDGVLVTDPILARIYDVGLDGTLRGEWGPQELKDQWQQILLTRARWERLEPLGWVAIGIAILLGMVVIVREVMRTKGNWSPKAVKLAPVDVKPQPLNATEVWIAVDPTFAKRTRRLAWVFVLVTGLFIAAEGTIIYSLTSNSKARGLLWYMGAVVVLVGVGLLLAAKRLYAQQHLRIGTNGQQLLFDPGNGKINQSHFDDVLASGRSLLIGKQFVAIYTQYAKPVFPMEQLTPLILARIPAANFVTRTRFICESLRRGSINAWLSLVAIALYLTLMGLELWHPKIVRTTIRAWVTNWLQ